MGCIETQLPQDLITPLFRLTLTWDVLKLLYCTARRIGSYRLTLTWDVLKLRCKRKYDEITQINFNMGCIETIED